MFDSPEKLILGLVTGIVFGFLLQKGRVAKFPVIVGQFLLRDFTVLKIMGTAVIVGAIGVYALVANGEASLHIKPALLGGTIIGGVLFGIGMVLLGYCPGTTVAACGEGHKDAFVGLLGMIVGALSFVALFDTLRPAIEGFGSLGKTTLPQITHSSPWLWIVSLAAMGAVLAFWNRRSQFTKGSSRGRHQSPRTSQA